MDIVLNAIGRLSKEKIKIELPNHKILQYDIPKKIQISSCFFRTGVCIRCGLCCKKIKPNLYWFLDEEYNQLPDKVREKLDIIKIKVNGLERDIYEYKNCDLIDDNNLCSVHHIKPIECALLPIFIDQNKYLFTYLRKRKRGRFKIFGCNMYFTEFDEEAFKEWDLVYLEKLNKIAKYLGVKTFLPEIIEELKKSVKNKSINNNILIWETKKK